MPRERRRPPPPVDLAAERRTGDLIRAAITAGQLTAVHDVSDGGIAVALAEMALAGGYGAIVDRPLPYEPAAALFGEDQGVYLVTIDDHAMVDFLHNAHDADVPVEPLGRTIANRLVFELTGGDFVVTLDALRAAHEGFFPALMGAAA